MSSVKLTLNPEQKDTRGLPVGFDPRNFYEYATQRAKDNAVGIERYLYQYMPLNLIRSFAFAIDPFRQLKTSAGRITPVNRHKLSYVNSVLLQRTNTNFYKAVLSRTDSPDTFTFTDGPNTGPVFKNQTPVLSYIDDTSRRTRLFGSDMGELTKWQAHVVSNQRRVDYTYSNRTYYWQALRPYYYVDHRDYQWSIQPSAATISYDSMRLCREEVMDRTLHEMQSKALGMFKGITPQGRTSTQFRNIVELRDVPHSILQLQETMRNLRKLELSFRTTMPSRVRERISNLKTSLHDIPKEYVSYAFGWRQLYRDTLDLLSSPAKVGKKIDFLIARSGKPTTYRTTRKFGFTYGSSTGFEYETIGAEYERNLSSLVDVSGELKMVVNTTFDFPPIDLPTFRAKEFNRQMGFVPTITDLYNLVPWTWLVDWFTGLGNYVEVIDTINSDPQLFNWGLITAKADGKLRTTYTAKVDSHEITGYVPEQGPAYDRVQTQPLFHTSDYQFNLQLRRDLSTIMDVKTTSRMESLTPYQLSILGSLLSMRLNFRG